MTNPQPKRKPLPLWPPEKPIPEFETAADEERFWTSYEFEDGDDSDWDEIEGPVLPRPIAVSSRSR